MPFSVPTTFSYPWAEVLNRHMAQLINPSTGGINVWDIRPTVGVNGQSLGPDHVGFTGYNSTSRAFERWNGSGWDVLTSSGSSSTVMPIWSSSNRPNSPSTGDYGFNTSTKQIERWSGTSWQPISSNDLEIWNTATRPILSGEQMGKIGFNSSTKQIERWNGSAWENVTSPVVPPLSTWSTVTRPSLTAQDAGQFGYNTTTKQIERWNGSGWDNVTPPLDSSSLMGGMPSWSTRPTVTSADAGKFGFNTSTKKIERWDGNAWIDVTPRSDTPFGMGSWNTSSRPTLTAADPGVFGYNTDTQKVERWTGSEWFSIPSGSATIPTWTTGSRPSNPALGTAGYNTTIPGLEVWNGTSWVAANSPTPTIGATAPTPPVAGQLWYDSALPGLKVWNGSAWVPANVSSGGGSTTLPLWTTSTRPSSPTTGTMGYNTQTGGPEMWNGSSWVPLNYPPADYRPTYQTWTDSTRPTGVPVGTVGYNSGTNQLEMWNGSSWQPISGGIPRHASRPLSPPEGYIYYNTGTDVVEYWNGTQWISLTRDGSVSGGQGDSWENPYQVDSNTDAQANKYYLLDPKNGPFVFKLPSNPAIGTEVCFRGLTSALTNSVYIDPNGKKFQGSTARRVYSGTTPICVTYISEAEGWMPSAAIPIEVVVVPPPADTGLYMWARSNLAVFRHSTQTDKVTLWSAEVNSNPIEFQTFYNAGVDTSWSSADIADRMSPIYLSSAINGKPALRFDKGTYTRSLVDKSVPVPPNKSTIFVVALIDNNNVSRPATFLISAAYDVNRSPQFFKGFVFSSWGIHQLANDPYTPNSSVPGYHLLYPESKRAPSATYAIHIYQIDYDTRTWYLLDTLGQYVSLGSFLSTDLGGTRSLILTADPEPNYLSGAVNVSPFYGFAGQASSAFSSFNMLEIKWYNNLLNSNQVKAVCDSLRTTYNLQYMM